MNDRLVDLEIRYTYLAQELEELSHVVFAQQKAIDELVREVKTLRRRLSEAEDPSEPRCDGLPSDSPMGQ